MCTLISRGMSVACTWELRGIFFLHLYFSCSSPTVLCAALWQASFLRMYWTISNTPNFTNYVRTSDHLQSHYFPAQKQKKSFGSMYAKKIEAKKTSQSTIHVICQR